MHFPDKGKDRKLPKGQPIVFISLGIKTHDREFLREVKVAQRDPVIPVISRLYKSVSRELSLHPDGSPRRTKMSPHPASLRLASLLLFSLVLHSALALKLCSFNVRSFGERKKENQNAMDVIVKVSCVRVLDSPYTFSPASDSKALKFAFKMR